MEAGGVRAAPRALNRQGCGGTLQCSFLVDVILAAYCSKINLILFTHAPLTSSDVRFSLLAA